MDSLFEPAAANVFRGGLCDLLMGANENQGIIGRSVPFLEKIARIWGLPGSEEERIEEETGKRFPRLTALHVRELIMPRDPLWHKFYWVDMAEGSAPRSILYDELLHALIDKTDDEKAVSNGDEQVDGTSKETVQALDAMPRHAKVWAYQDVAEALIEDEMHKRLAYNGGKLSQFWLALINLLQYTSHVRVVKYV